MSNSVVNDLRSALNDAGSLLRTGDAIVAPVRRLAFWSAVALPFLYVPLLVMGLDSPRTTAAFLALLGCNAVALFVGHPHQRE